MNISITDIHIAGELLRDSNQYRVVAISNPDIPIEWEYAKEALYLRFHDVDLPEPKATLATVEDCRQALDFMEKGGHLLVHCWAGVSRSTAIVLGYLLSQFSDHQKAVEKLFELRSCAMPNSHIVRLMCYLLKKENLYQKIQECIIEHRSI